jgi:hypothetical protein
MLRPVTARIALGLVALAAAALVAACAPGARTAPAATVQSARPAAVAAALPPGDPPVEWDGRTQMVEDPEAARKGQGGVVKPLGAVGKNRDELRRRLTALVRQTIDYGIKIREDYKAKQSDAAGLIDTLMRGEPMTVQYARRFHPSIVVRYQIDFGANLIRVTQPGESDIKRGAGVARRVFDIYFAPQSVSPLPATYDKYCDLKKPWDRAFKEIGRSY